MEAQVASEPIGSGPHASLGPTPQHLRPRVFIISDVRLYREGLSLNLTQDGSLQVLGTFGPSALANDQLKSQAPDAIIFDIKMRDGLQLARELHARWPHIKIVA